MMAVELHNAVAMALGVSLSTTVLFDYPTLEALAGYLVRDVLALEAPEKPNGKPHKSKDNGQADVELAELAQLSEHEVESLLEQELATIDELFDGEVK